jgi:hypothetical protein
MLKKANYSERVGRKTTGPAQLGWIEDIQDAGRLGCQHISKRFNFWPF